MPDTRSHRGPDPRDARLFDAEHLPRLKDAAADLSWLWGRGYAEVSSVKLVGDRYRLTERQRLAVRRSACSESARSLRLGHEVRPDSLRDQLLLLDGFNVVTTVEAALGGAVILKGRDGAFRDLVGVHGTYRKVEETLPAVDLLGEALEKIWVARAVWYLDRPVSNSGRLKAALLDLAGEHSWDWQVELVYSPDAILKTSDQIIATSDSAILDCCHRWLNLARWVVETTVPKAHIIDLDVELPSLGSNLRPGKPLPTHFGSS